MSEQKTSLFPGLEVPPMSLLKRWSQTSNLHRTKKKITCGETVSKWLVCRIEMARFVCMCICMRCARACMCVSRKCAIRKQVWRHFNCLNLAVLQILWNLWFNVGVVGSVEILPWRRIKKMQPSLSNGGKHLVWRFFCCLRRLMVEAAIGIFLKKPQKGPQ